MNKLIINQEFHEDIFELITEVCSKIIEEKDTEQLERLVRKKIDDFLDTNEIKNDIIRDVDDSIDSVKSDMEDLIDDKISEAKDDMKDVVETDIKQSIKDEITDEIPKLIESALMQRKVDREELIEAVKELKEDWNKMIAEQVKYHFKILASFMMGQSKD